VTRGKDFAERLRAEHRKAERERLEDTLAFQLNARRIRGFKREVEWCPGRKWRSDFLWPEEKLIVEVEGGQSIRGGGRHQRSSGFSLDCEKYAEAALLGFTVLRFATKQVVGGEATDYIEKMLRKLREGAA
jgi:very-short-patch-repair endonuclease